uniref:isocitrate dehydrogenase kinase/phosphatase-domain containing protein n=1 Tax=Vibrio parahaemolyticus TaxID=670 RepID=UPI00301B7C0E
RPGGLSNATTYNNTLAHRTTWLTIRLLVKEHDRVGRMADTQEFENFVLEKKSEGQAALGRQQRITTPWLTGRHG